MCFFVTFAVNIMYLVLQLLCLKLLFLLRRKLFWCMLKRIHRITRICRVHLLDVLSPVTTAYLQRIAQLPNVINRHIHAKRGIGLICRHLHTRDKTVWDRFQLWPTNDNTVPLGEGTENAFYFQCFTDNFLFYYDRNENQKVTSQ